MVTWERLEKRSARNYFPEISCWLHTNKNAARGKHHIWITDFSTNVFSIALKFRYFPNASFHGRKLWWEFFFSLFSFIRSYHHYSIDDHESETRPLILWSGSASMDWKTCWKERNVLIVREKRGKRNSNKIHSLMIIVECFSVFQEMWRNELMAKFQWLIGHENEATRVGSLLCLIQKIRFSVRTFGFVRTNGTDGSQRSIVLSRVTHSVTVVRLSWATVIHTEPNRLPRLEVESHENMYTIFDAHVQNRRRAKTVDISRPVRCSWSHMLRFLAFHFFTSQNVGIMANMTRISTTDPNE